MRLYLLLFILLKSLVVECYAQLTVFDPNHFKAINDNAVVRSSADILNSSYTGQIQKMQNDVNLNLSAVTTVQNVIYRSLTEVNALLKNGLAVRNIAYLVEDILKYQTMMKEVALHEPWMLLVAEESIREMKKRSVNLALEVSDFVLYGGKDNMMNYNSRDQLLRKISNELMVIRGLCYGIYRSMYWAQHRGFLNTINPYQGWINRDIQKANEIKSRWELLKK